MVQLLDRIESMQKSCLRSLIHKHGVGQICDWAGVKIESTMYAFGQDGKSNIPARNWLLLVHQSSMAGEYEPLELCLVAGQKIVSINLPAPNPNVLGSLFIINKLVNEFRTCFQIGDETECRFRLQEIDKELNQLRSDLSLLHNRFHIKFKYGSYPVE